jgi:hypothetical protein
MLHDLGFATGLAIDADSKLVHKDSEVTRVGQGKDETEQVLRSYAVVPGLS